MPISSELPRSPEPENPGRLHRVVKPIAGIAFHHEPKLPRRLEQEHVTPLTILDGHHARRRQRQGLGVAGFRHRPPAGDVWQRFERRRGCRTPTRRRASMTSNCSGPTTPTIGWRRPVAGMNTCIRPSSSSCRTASSKRLCRTSAGRRYANRSAGNCGIGGYRSLPAGIQRVADGEPAGVDEADDVARVRLRHRLAVAAEEAIDAREAERSCRAAR